MSHTAWPCGPKTLTTPHGVQSRAICLGFVLMPRKPRTDGKPAGTRRLDKRAVKRGEVDPSIAKIAERKPTDLGPNAIELNEALLYDMAKTHASFDVLAKIFGVSDGFLASHVTYRPIIDKARADACHRLVSAQFSTAINDRNPTMQIWLGKQFLNQKDVTRTEHTGADGKPIETDNTTRAVAYIPDNGRDPAKPESPTPAALEATNNA